MKKGKSNLFSFRPTVSIIALSVAAAFALTACGGGGGGGDDNGGGGGGGGGGGSTIGYVTQLGATEGAGSILGCKAASDGMLTCAPEADATATTLPAPISIALAGSNAYILNGAESGETIYRCSVTNNSISACAQETGATELTGTKDLAVSANNMYVLKEGQLMQCDLTDGTVGACSDEREGFAVTGLNIAESFAFGGNRVWIANSGGAGFVLSCDVASETGAVSNCSEAWTAAGPTNPAPLAVALDASAANLYVLLRDENSILRCAVGEAGALTCDPAATALPAAAGDDQPERIAVNNGYVYVTRASSTDVANNNVIKCTVGSGGAITAGSCVSAITASTTSPITGEVTDIAF